MDRPKLMGLEYSRRPLLIAMRGTIIATEPNELLKPLHDRMPVILNRETEDVWLDPAR